MSVLECLAHIQPPCIQGIDIKECHSTISISADYLPASLQCLKTRDCSKLTFSEQLQHKSLTEIYIKWCASLSSFPVQALPSLHNLSISECPNLVSLPALELAAPCLQELYIEDCPKIDCFAEDCLPPSLEKLQVIQCQKLASCIASKGLQSQGLTYLLLENCHQVKSFPSGGCLPASLEYLRLRFFPDLQTLDCKGLCHLTSLQHLAISCSEKLKNITEEHFLASIANIYIGRECPLRCKLEEMEDLQIQFVHDNDYYYY